MKRKILLLSLAISIIMGNFNLTFAGLDKPTIIINGEIIEGDGFLNKEGKIMVPLRHTANKLGYKVKWDQVNKRTRLIKNSKEVLIELDENSSLKDGKTYISGQKLSSSLDLVLGWNSKNKTLKIRNIKKSKEPIFKESTDEKITKELKHYMEALVASENFHGSVLLAKKGEILLKEGYGYADFKQQIENKAQTRFPIGSVTKQFTAQALVKLCQEGLLNMENKVATYLPNFPRGDEITVHNLLTHTSGLVSYTDMPDFHRVDPENKDPEKMLELVETMDLKFTPGEKFDYSNTNYLLAGIIVEKISGQKLSDFLKEITSPLNMENTGIIASQLANVNDVTPYIGYLEVMEVDDDSVLNQAYGAGSMYSTIEDLYKWDRRVQEKEMLKAYVPMDNERSYGYGLMIEDTEFGKMIYHGGNTLGSTSYLGNVLGEDITVIILSNSGGYNTGPLVKDLLSIVLEKDYKLAKEKEIIEIKDESLYNKYVGSYEFINGSYLNIFANEGKLYAQATGQVAFEIFPESLDKFFAKKVKVQIEFILDDGEKAPALKFTQRGVVFICNRVRPEEKLTKNYYYDTLFT